MELESRIGRIALLIGLCLLAACGQTALAPRQISDSGVDDRKCDECTLNPVDVEMMSDSSTPGPDSRGEVEPVSLDAALTVDASFPPCRTTADCPSGSFCSFVDEQVIRCSTPSTSPDRSILATPGACRPIPCGSAGCLGKSCTTNFDCSPDEACYGQRCGSPPMLLGVYPDCADDCPPVHTDSRTSVLVCLCQSC